MAAKLALALVVTLVVVSCVVATPGYGHGGASSYQNNNLGGGGGHGHGGHGWQQDYYAKPSYKYSYGVSDHHTGDNKNAYEHRDGDSVQGGYSLQEPDGSWRMVSYHADNTGFHAKVHRTKNAHPQGWGHGGHGHQG